jgi:hypothetical protein
VTTTVLSCGKGPGPRAGGGVVDAAAEWSGSAATFLAVLVALFGPGWERHRRRPRLVVTSEPPEELGTNAKVVSARTEDGSTIHWLRMAVTNEGRSTAEDVRLISLRIEAPGARGRQAPSRELKWADVATDTCSLPPRVSRLVDVVHLTETQDESHVRRRGLVSGVMPLSGADRGRPDSVLWQDLDTGRYAIHVSLSARDVPAAHYAITFTVDRDAEFPTVARSLLAARAERVTRA